MNISMQQLADCKILSPEDQTNFCIYNYVSHLWNISIMILEKYPQIGFRFDFPMIGR